MDRAGMVLPEKAVILAITAFLLLLNPISDSIHDFSQYRDSRRRSRQTHVFGPAQGPAPFGRAAGCSAG